MRPAWTIASTLALLVCACGDEPAPAATAGGGGNAGAGGGAGGGGGDLGGFGACGPGATRAGAACCAAGEVTLDDGSCLPAGIPPEQCAIGFMPDGDGACDAVLPARACAKGSMAVPGERTCREVAPCGSGTWGDVPVEPSTQYVDASYVAGDSDGTAAKPWPTIQDGVDAAEPDAIVAVAAGSYAEYVYIAGKPIRLWGRCPADVEIVGLAASAAGITVAPGADGTEVRDLAVTGATKGVLVTEVANVLVDRVWMHDTPEPAVMAQSQSQDLVASVAIERSLVEGATEAAIVNLASKVAVQGSVVRDTKPRVADLKFGHGFSVQAYQGVRPELTVMSSVVERNTAGGVLLFGADASIEASVVRDALPKANDATGGQGIIAQSYPNSRMATALTVRASVVESNREVGIYVYGSDATVENCVVRDTQPREADDRYGRGINVQPDPDSGLRGSLTLRASAIDRNHEAGVFGAGSDLEIEASLVRDTQPMPANQESGYGVGVQDHPDLGSASLLLRASVVDRSFTGGVSVIGSTAEIEGSVVRDTVAQPSDQRLGRGIGVQDGPDSGLRSTVSIRGSVIDGSTDVGICGVDSDLTVEGTRVSNTQALFDGTFGDGIAVGGEASATLVLVDSLVEGSARAGVSSFGASVAISDSMLECNAIHLDSELWGSLMSSFDDAGGNRCGCAADSVACAIVSSNLQAPEPADPVGP